MEGFKREDGPSYRSQSGGKYDYYSDANDQFSYSVPGRAAYLVQHCNELIRLRDSYNDPVEYASYIICAIFDNMDLDLCQIVPRYDRDHEDATNRISCLLGFDSPHFKLIFSHAKLFEYFLAKFTRHAEQSHADFRTARSSLYLWLLETYLKHLFPASDEQLSYIRSMAWDSGKSSSPSSAKKKKFRTPFQLIRTDLFGDSDVYGGSMIFGHSMYSRMFLFMESLLANYAVCKQSSAQLVSLKFVTEWYLKFILSKTRDPELESFKSRLWQYKNFSTVLVPIMKSSLSTTPLNISFVSIFELFIQLLYPGDSVYADSQLCNRFRISITAHFTDVIKHVLDRLLYSDLLTLVRMDILRMYLVDLFNENFIRMLYDLEISAVDYLIPLQQKLKRICDEEIDSSFTAVLTNMIHPVAERDAEERRQSAKFYLSLINERTNCSFSIYKNRMENQSDLSFIPGHLENVEEESRRNFSLNQSANLTMDSTFGSVKKAKSTLPDAVMDQWTNMYHLTPKGIEQVAAHDASFDFEDSARACQDFTRERIWENKWLAEKLNKIALDLANKSWVRFLRVHSTNPVLRPITSVVMQPRSPPYGVPVYGRNVPRRPETINLRLFASYPVMALLLIIIWTLISYFVRLF